MHKNIFDEVKGKMSNQLSVRIPEELDESLSRIAEKLRLKRSIIVRMALEKFVEDCMVKGEEIPYERIKHLLGSFSSGYPDLGASHRKHLLKILRRHHD